MSGLTVDILDLVIKTVALAIGGAWALYKIRDYRQFKHWIQLDIDAEIFPLARPEHAAIRTWNKKGKVDEERPAERLTHAVEIRLRFVNRGRTRVRLFNVQAALNTMRAPDGAKFDEQTGRLVLDRLLTVGNLVPEMRVGERPVDETSFYYIEPQVEQVISHLCLIPPPRELLQVSARFNFEQRRMFPKALFRRAGPRPHSASRTFPVAASVE